jgi:hypothetical protein
MDDNDKNDIIKKINTAGNNDSKEPDIITTTTIMEMIMRVGLMITTIYLLTPIMKKFGRI